MTRDEILSVLNYDSETGKFFRARDSARKRTGDEAGYPTIDGYLRAKIGTRGFLLHRVAWLIVYGVWPDREIDHINGDRADNRISNLRLANRSQNMMNSKAKSTNRLGIKGVRQMPNGKFQARIRGNGKTYHLGTFPTIQDAREAWDVAAQSIHGDFKLSHTEN